MYVMTLILGVNISETSYTSATSQIRTWALAGESRYACIANVHILMTGHDSSDFNKVINNADLVTPDGMPLVWMLRLKGVKGQERVYGPTLMLHILEMAAREQIPVGFYGADEATLKILVGRMRERFPGLQVTYAYSPPFRPLDEQESDQITDEITASGVRILFVGLGCPKQEIWMAEHKGKIPTVMLGVGAAFDFHAGRKPQAPTWMQAIGLEWFFRLLHEPRRLARRYLYNNPRFILLALADLLGILERGKKEA
jgi:N-acetylglucosaminyldiphosphoundecaprenol N-acetyl-beta-D-mannosaminyltransferase